MVMVWSPRDKWPERAAAIDGSRGLLFTRSLRTTWLSTFSSISAGKPPASHTANRQFCSAGPVTRKTGSERVAQPSTSAIGIKNAKSLGDVLPLGAILSPANDGDKLRDGLARGVRKHDA